MRLSLTGLGIVSALGQTPEEIRAAAARSAPYERADVHELRAYYGSRELRRVSHFCRLALLAAHRALDDAQLTYSPDRLGISIATGHGPVQTTFDFLDSIYESGAHLASPTAFSTSVHNVAASTLSIMLGCTGPCLSTSQFSMSLGAAFLAAQAQFARDAVDVVLVGAVDEAHPVLAQALCPGEEPGALWHEGAIFWVVTREGYARRGVLSAVCMGRGAHPLGAAPFPGELPAGQAFALARASCSPPTSQTLVATHCSGFWSSLSFGEKHVHS